MTKEYCPTEDEVYMNDRQVEFFREKLLSRRLDLVESAKGFVETLKESTVRKPDPVDQSSANAEMSLDFQNRYRQQNVIREIDYALGRMADGEYGYCEITGEEIGLKSLLARHMATMCVEIQEQHERMSHRPGKYAMPCLL
jgi:DnaK suppressor protein